MSRRAHAGPSIIILGAPRSGTNMLRDLLSQLPGCGTWPCDEINAIWRYGNRNHPTDELKVEDARRSVRRYIRRRFLRLAAKHSLTTVVEKTCANCLRVGFVDKVIPEARYIFLVRDGRDAAASAMKRWSAPVNFAYLIRKARWVPAADLPHYGLAFLAGRLTRLLSSKRRVALWGPVFVELSQLVKREGLAAACAVQWARCVEDAESELAGMDRDQVLRLRYEEFVENPGPHLRELADFMGTSLPPERVEALVAEVTTLNVGKWRSQLNPEDLAVVENRAGPVLQRYGYWD